MNKFLRIVQALLYLGFTLFRKVFGLVWYYVAVPFRGYSRNVVHNYILEHQNQISCPRLMARKPTRVHGSYVIQPFHGAKGGYIKYRKISWLEYQLVFWILWGWVDDDSNYDTSNEYADGDTPLYGNSFDIGDMRNKKYAYFDFELASFWNIRNTGYNFSYVQMENDTQHFYYKFKYLEFGYKITWDGSYYLEFQIGGK